MKVVVVEGWLVSQQRFAMAEERGQFRNPEEGVHPLLEVIARRLMIMP
jgi:hypothetical protein